MSAAAAAMLLEDALPAEPTAPSQRIELLDVLRGFAIFGILLVNMQLFFAPIYLQISQHVWWSSPLDGATKQLIYFLAQGKFYTLFSFLFGMGLALQMERAVARGTSIAPLFARRMLGLFLIGLAHAFLVWFGDILVLYSLLGFVLILFRNRSFKTLWTWAAVLLVIPLLLFGGIVVIIEIARLFPESAAELNEGAVVNAQEMAFAIDQARSAYAEGSYLEMVGERAAEVLFIYSWTFFVAPQVLGLFLLGLIFGRRRFFQQIEQHLDWLRSAIWWFWAVGLTGNLAGTLLMKTVDFNLPSLAGLAQQAAFAVGVPALTFFYVSSIVLLWQRPAARRRLRHLAPVGRMALSNYLMHSLVFTTLANSYGLGLYGKISPSVGVLMTFVMFSLQIPLSAWWLNRFRFGPLEWLWRSLTYRVPQPLRR